MNIVAFYKNAERTVVDAQITSLQPGETPFDYGSTTLSLADIDLTRSAFWPATIAAWVAAGGIPAPYTPQTVLSQDLMAQFTAADATAIQAAISGNVQFWLLWQALTTQKDPMIVTNARFLAGWNALVQVLGQARMDAIAAALGVTVA
jgi:hypothetical protein